MATAADAGLILQLYEMRREERLRKARKFLLFEFNPKTAEELYTVSRAPGTEGNEYWRQVTSFWEMSASLVLRGALDADLYLDSAGEGIVTYAKFHHFHAVTEKESGNRFMKNTAELIDTYPRAKAFYEQVLPRFKV